MTARLRRHPLLASLLSVLPLLGAVWVVKLAQVAQVARSVSTHAEFWSQPQGQPGGLLYVALGDSAAQGIGASSPARGYVGLLAARMRDRTGAPVEVIDLSTSGARISDVLDTQLPALAALGRTPDVLTVAIGGNDVRADDRSTFAAEAERLTAALPAGAHVADAPCFMHGHWERDAQQAAALLTASAVAHDLRPVALHEALRAQGSTAMLTQFAADWSHPNDPGHRVWSGAFWQELADDPQLRQR